MERREGESKGTNNNMEGIPLSKRMGGSGARFVLRIIGERRGAGSH